MERLLSVEAVKKNAHADNNGALRLAARNGNLAVVERLLAIKTVKENAHAVNNDALRLAAVAGLSVTAETIEAVNENVHASNNNALQWAAEKGHLAVVERLLTVEAVKENAHAMKNKALRLAAKESHLAVIFILTKTYQSLNRQLPTDITIQNQTLDDFVKDYQEKLEYTASELIEIFPRALIKIIDDYAEVALGTVINKPIQQNQAFEPGIVLSEPPFTPTLTFSMQTATIFSHTSPDSTNFHRNLIGEKQKGKKVIK